MVAFEIDPALSMYLEFENWLSESDLSLLEQEKDEFESVVGVSVLIGKAPTGYPKWCIEEHSDIETPSLSWNINAKKLTSLISQSNQVFSTFSLLQSLSHSAEHTVFVKQPETVEAAINLLESEGRNTYPYFELRNLNWQNLWEQAIKDRPENWDEFGPWAMELVAQLGDAHTAVIDDRLRGYSPPYRGEFRDGVLRLLEIPSHSAAAEAGVHKNSQVDIAHPNFWEKTTGASPQQFHSIAARNALAMAEPRRTFSVTDSLTHHKITWVEEAKPVEKTQIFEISTIDEKTTYVKISLFAIGVGIEEEMEKLCRASTLDSLLIVDLRGNLGGNIILATTLRNMFLRHRALIGYSSFTTGQGSLSPLQERWADPHPTAHWRGQLRILIDEMTYSASEDFILGLQGLEHVSVQGRRTGGGSGRPRSIPLGSHLSLRISTCITYDRPRKPVEYFGIAPDAPLPAAFA
ncbi:MAG: S41 family peptidase [Rothia sp. (in: high G+C Gram-positive bacteria)]|nr:S41 family peptidase [Rothia sp. (in: high G+C Gram-positive bacteria)]